MSENRRETRAGDPAHEADHLDRRILQSAGWVMASRASAAVVSTVSVLVLARLLDPKTFGLVALAAALLAVLQLLQTSGLGSALIYRRHGIEEAAGSVLVYSTLSSLVIFLGVLVASPWIAQAFGQPEATNVIRGLGVVLIIRALGVAPTAVLERDLNFRARTYGDVGSSIVSAVVAISLAFSGLGVWALILGSLAAAAVQTGISWYLAPVHPSPRHARWEILRGLLGYGRFVTAGNVITLATRTLDNLVVARLLGPAALGVYSLAFRLANLPTNVFVGIVGRVMFPAYAILQDDKPAFRKAYLLNMQRIALLAFPVSVALAVATNPLVSALLGDKWLAAVDPLRILAAWALVRSIVSPSGAVYQAAGKPHYVPLFALPILAVMIPGLLILTPKYGPTGAALAMLIAMVCSAVPSLIAAMRILELGGLEFIRSLLPAVMCSAALALTMLVVLVPSESLGPIARLAVVAISGGLVYLASAAFLARDTVARILSGRRRGPRTQFEPGA